MENETTEHAQELSGRNSPSAATPSFWLLQKDDTPFLCLSFLSSVLLHGALFVVLAATRFFHPFAGVPGEFDLVWFSPAATEPEGRTKAQKTAAVDSAAVPVKWHRAHRTRQARLSAPGTPAVSPPSVRTATPVQPPPSPAVQTGEQSPPPRLPVPESDTEMAISRFGGKVVEIVDKDMEIPVFKVFSASQKSPGQRALVQYLPETEERAAEKPAPGKKKEAPAKEPVPEKVETVPVKAVEVPAAVPRPVVVPVPKKEEAVMETRAKKSENDVMKGAESEVHPPAEEREPIVEKVVMAVERPVQPRQSSSVAHPAAESRTPVRRPAPPLREESPVVSAPPPPVPVEAPRLSSPGAAVKAEPVHRPSPPVKTAAKPPETATRIMPRAERPADRPLAPPVPKPEPLIPATSSVMDRKPAAVAGTVVSVTLPKKEPAPGKPAPVEPEKPRAIFMPPLAGDLKIVITGSEDIKVEAVFREFRKIRRKKPLSRGEARTVRNAPVKRARTSINVHEAAIETAEEGVYCLTVRSSDGKPVTAAFVLKIRASGREAVTRNLGRRTLADGALLARILMPEGILWDDDEYFTGSMEDSDSITKFHTEDGLVWREYR